MRFKPEDFQITINTPDNKQVIKLEGFEMNHGLVKLSVILGEQIAAQANAKLKEWLDAATTVYDSGVDLWVTTKLTEGLKAKLVCIEEIKDA